VQLLLLQPVLHADRELVEVAATLRWSPLTVVFALVSAWWVKGPLFVLAGLVSDLRARAWPVTALAVTGSVLLASLASGMLKEAFDRARPPVADPDFAAAVAVPGSPSFPSGHASTAFAAAAALAVLVPRLRVVAFAVAAAVAVSRVYLGVHYAIDVMAGAALGIVLGLAIGAVVRRAVAARARAVAAADVHAV